MIPTTLINTSKLETRSFSETRHNGVVMPKKQIRFNCPGSWDDSRSIEQLQKQHFTALLQFQKFFGTAWRWNFFGNYEKKWLQSSTSSIRKWYCKAAYYWFYSIFLSNRSIFEFQKWNLQNLRISAMYSMVHKSA